MRSNVSPARLLRWIPRLLLIAAVTLVFIYPFWWMMVNSLNTNAQVFGPPRLLPQSWRWQNYVEIFQKQPFARHYANTLLVAGVGTLGNVLISALSGYGFARVRFPGRGILFILLLTALMMPVEVIIIPLFYQMKAWHLTDSLLPLIFLPVFCSQGALSAFMFRQFFITVPKELEEAGRLDGMGHGGIFFRIMLPMAIPSVATITIFIAVGLWNSYMGPLIYLTRSDVRLLSVYLKDIVTAADMQSLENPELINNHVANESFRAAAIFLSTLPILVVYPFLQKYFIVGMTIGAVKE